MPRYAFQVSGVVVVHGQGEMDCQGVLREFLMSLNALEVEQVSSGLGEDVREVRLLVSSSGIPVRPSVRFVEKS